MPDPAKYDDYASQGSPKTATQWNFTPKALYYSSKFWFERYHLPVLITENGYAGLDHIMLDGKVHDPQRIDFLHRYLLEVAHAINDGIPVLGYSVWSLFDNFECGAYSRIQLTGTTMSSRPTERTYNAIHPSSYSQHPLCVPVNVQGVLV